MSLLDQVKFTPVDSESNTASTHQVEVYALSTCAFCERALEFLKEKGVRHQYVFMDLLEVEFKRELKTELKSLYGNIPVFPLLVVDRSIAISGFNPEKYLEALGLA